MVVTRAQSWGVKPRSFDSSLASCRWGFRLVWALFTRSDTWQPETGKGLCVIAVKGTDQINHSTLNCHRSAKIKGENSPVLCRNLFFPMQRCHAWPHNRMWAKHTAWQQQPDNTHPVTLKAGDYISIISLKLSDHFSNLMQTSPPDFIGIFSPLLSVLVHRGQINKYNLHDRSHLQYKLYLRWECLCWYYK